MSNNLDKRELRTLFSNLEKLGLSEKESQVYLFLLGRELEVGSSKIVLATKLHGQYIYDALAKLEEKGLVKHIIKNGRKKFLANPPSRIDSLVQEKILIANDVRDKLESLFQRKEQQEFEVYQGEDQFVAHEFKMIEEAPVGANICVIAGKGDKFTDIMGDTHRRPYNAAALAKNISVLYIGTSDQEEYLSSVKARRPLFDYRIMPGLHTSSVSTSIHENAVLFQVYGDPLLVFKIKSKQIADDYQSFFNSLWELCTEK
jgi:sugar-specific transcriptional regulator TrmB